MKNIFSFKKIELYQALSFGAVMCLAFLALFSFFVGPNTALPSAIEATALVLGVYGVVKARNQWVFDKGSEQLQSILQGIRIFSERYREHLSVLNLAPEDSNEVLKFKLKMAGEYNKILDLISNATYLNKQVKQELFDLVFVPANITSFEDIEGYGDRLDKAIEKYDAFLSSETSNINKSSLIIYKSILQPKSSDTTEKPVLQGLLDAIKTAPLIIAIVIGYTQWPNLKDLYMLNAAFVPILSIVLFFLLWVFLQIRSAEIRKYLFDNSVIFVAILIFVLGTALSKLNIIHEITSANGVNCQLADQITAGLRNEEGEVKDQSILVQYFTEPYKQNVGFISYNYPRGTADSLLSGLVAMEAVNQLIQMTRALDAQTVSNSGPDPILSQRIRALNTQIISLNPSVTSTRVCDIHIKLK